MSNMPKAAALTAALLLTVGAVPALAQDAPALPEVAASELEYQGEITFWNTMRDFEFAEVQKLIDAWTTAHPGISVKHTAQSFDTARADYQNAAPAGTAPDILRADIGWTIGFADDGYLLDLTDKVSDWDDYIGVPLATAPPASVPPKTGGLRVLLGSGQQAVVEYTVPVGQQLALLCHIPGHIEKGMVGAVDLRSITISP